MAEVKTRNLINMILEGEQEMDYIQDYFLCSSCQNKDFRQIYNFSIRFHGVNFSDDLIYDKLTDEIFQCTKCDKTFTRDEVEQVLDEIRKNVKEKRLGSES
jgi:predicted Zn-dependent peptidase